MKMRFIALATVAALASGGAFAQKAGDWVLGAGWLHFAPQDSSSPLTVTAPRPAVVPGSGATVSNADTLGLSVNYFIDSNWAIEGVIGVPPKFKLDGTGTLAQAGQLGEATMWNPTLLAKYYFGSSDSAFRPYVGLGASYVWFSGIHLTPSLQGTVASLTHTPVGATVTTADIDSTLSAVFNVGAAYQFDKNWGVSFSVSYLPLKTKAVLSTTAINGLPVMTSEASIKVNPIVTYLALTYRF